MKVSISVNKPQTAATAIVSDHCDRMRLDGSSDEGIQVIVPKSDGHTGHGVGDGIYCYVFDNDVGDGDHGHAIHGVVTIMLVTITFIVTNVTRRD